jgi:hypothetical protein
LITVKDLQEAIAECQGTRNPDSKTCMKLAAFYTILDHLQDETEPIETNPTERKISPLSFSALEQTVNFSGTGEFAKAINGLPSETAWGIMSELMGMLQMIEPKLYQAVMRKIQEVEK